MKKTTIKQRLSIAQVAAKVGVSPKTIARWEKLGKIRKAKRDWRGWRVFESQDVVKIKNFYETVFEIE